MSSPSSDVKKTPLYKEHVALKAKLVAFGGWSMPVSYDGVLAEHKAVRENVGLFDVSHMGEIRVKGLEAAKFLQAITINDISKLTDGAGQYSAILNEQGGMIDDLIIYRLHGNEFFICVNASNTEKDYQWIKSKTKGFSVNVSDESSHWSQIAVQGPQSLKLLEGFVPDLKNLAYTSIKSSRIFGENALIARTGYTGEWGYEVYLPNETAAEFWRTLLKETNGIQAQPVGLGARDTLRLEACYLLYGNDMNDTVTPLEAGISWATKLDKGEFIGRQALIAQKEAGLKRKIVAFKMTEDGIPRHAMPVQNSSGKVVGEVTSGSVLPTVGGAGGMALVETSLQEGSELLIDVRGKLKKAVIVKRPLYPARVKQTPI